MSWGKYEHSIKLVSKCKYYTNAAGKSTEEIEEAGKLLGIEFLSNIVNCKTINYKFEECYICFFLYILSMI